MSAFADSSLLVSCYALDTHSAQAIRHLHLHRGNILVSPLVVLEVSNALQLRVFRRIATAEETRLAIAEFEKDLANGTLQRSPMPPSAWSRARQILLKHTATPGTRSLDILQVATALVLKADTFLSFDRTQSALARAEGLVTPVGSD